MTTREQYEEWAARIYRDLMGLIIHRREWREITDAWRANRGLTFREGVTGWIARMYADWTTLAIRKQDDRAPRSICLYRLFRTALSEGFHGCDGLDPRADRNRLGKIARRAREHANKIAAHHSEDDLRFDLTYGEIDETIDRLLDLARPYMRSLGAGPLEEPKRQYNRETILRRAWLAPDWSERDWPPGYVVRRGEHFPFLDYLAEDDRLQLLEAIDEVIATLPVGAADVARSGSPIRAALEELELPASDSAVQAVKDELMARGIDWRPGKGTNCRG